MKKSLVIIMAILCVGSLNAQYKKAKFMSKQSFFADGGLVTRLPTDGRSTTNGIFFASGNANPQKRVYMSFQLELVFGSKFSYTTPNYYSAPPAELQVSGKTKADFSLGYNFGYFLVDNANPDNKLIPYLNVGMASVFGNTDGTTYSWSPSANTMPAQTPNGTINGLVASGGAGVVYKITETIGINFLASYTAIVYDINKEPGKYQVLTNHPTLHIGIRFSSKKDD